MSRWLSVLGLFAGLAALVGAQGPSGPTPAEQARLLARNRQLVRDTVENSLELTGKDDPLQRAGTCTRLVKMWAGEVQRAAQDHDSPRVAEMGRHLNSVVERGVVANLQSARGKIQPDSPMERMLFSRRDEALQVLRPLEDALQKADFGDSARDLEPVLSALSEGRRHVESATK